MSTNAPSDNAPLLLKELKIPGRTGPVSSTPPRWGINLAAAQLNFPRQGLLCQAGPWGTMGLRDSLRILRDSDVQIGLETVGKDEVDTELQMFVEAKHLPEGMHTISYTVTRLGGTAELSEVMQVLVKLTLPGGPDHSEGPGHPGLVMSIPEDVLKGGVHQDNVDAGVSITFGIGDGSPPYLYAAAGDTLQISWGGRFFSGPALTQEQAEGKTPVIVTIPKETIVAAGDSGEAGLAVAFEVYDLVDNRSDGWSVAKRVVVTLDKTRLGAPLLKEALNNVLDVDELGDADGTVQVVAVNPSPPPIPPQPIDFEVGDTLFVRIKGTPKEGPPIDIELPGKVLIGVPSVPEITVSNAVLRQLAQAEIALSFRLEKADGSAQRDSKTQFISAIGEIHRLAAPVALEAKQGAIDPLDPDLKQVTIEIAFDPSFAAGQPIKLFWLGTRPDLSPYLPNLNLRLITQGDMDAKLPLKIIVDKQYLTPIIGGKLELYYQLLIEDSVLATMSTLNQTHAIRESIHADILQIGEPRQELPEPKVDGVVDGALPADTNGTTLTVDYLKTFKDDIVTRFWEGSITGVNSDWIKLSSFTAGEPVPFPIKAELIKGNEGGTVKAYYQIERAAGGTSYSDTLEFSVGVALDLQAPKIKEAVNNVLQPFAAKDTLTAIVRAFPNMVGTQVSVTWAGTPGEGSTTVGPITVTAQQDLEIPLPNSVVAFNLGNNDVKVTYVVTRNGTTEGSKELALQVAVIADGDPELGIPLITEAANTGAGPELNINALTADATLRVNNWLLIFPDQYVWSRLKGTKKDNTTYSKTFWQPPASKTDEEWIKRGFNTHTIPLSDLRDLKNDSELELEVKTAFGGSSDEKYATTFKERVYNVKTAPPLVWDDNPVTLTVHTASFEGASPDWDIIADTFSLPLYRGAKEGVPPYTYKSENESVATVDQLGNIKAVGKGKTIIMLEDDAGETKTLEATVIQEHYTLLYSPNPGTQEEFVVWAGKVGGKLPPPYFLDLVLSRLYRPKNTSWHHVSYRRNTSTEEMMNPSLYIQFVPFPNIAPFLVVKE
ncbi:Ig-like domain-containing protein [Pseudomonas sp. AIG]